MIFFAAMYSMKTDSHARRALMGGSSADNFFCAPRQFFDFSYVDRSQQIIARGKVAVDPLCSLISILGLTKWYTYVRNGTQGDSSWKRKKSASGSFATNSLPIY